MAFSRLRIPARLCGLSLGALLAACGGGGGSTPEAPTPTPPPSTVAVTLTAPVAEDVFNAALPLTVTARVTVNGANATDGTPVRFSASPGVFAATATTLSGIATATLGQIAAGRQQLTVSATAADGQSATATRTIYLRPAPARLEVLVPAYFYPSAGSPWDLLASGAAAFPGLSITAILNPSNGEFTTADVNYARAATQFVAAGGKVIGYVHSNYGTRALSAVQADIDNYLRLYGRGIVSGIFVDEMSSDPRQLPYYQTLFNYIKAQGSALRVVGNPGAVPDAAYAAVADVLVTFEGQRGAFSSYDPRSSTESSWVYGRPNSTLSALGHNVPSCAAMQEAVVAAATARYNVGLVFFTSREYDPVTGTGNPWAGLPAYWNVMLQSLDAVNRGAALPAC